MSASASTTYVLGIGGLSRKALKQNAVADMMNKAELVGSQEVINITTKVSTRVITPLFVRVTVTAYGTVVQFDAPSFGYTVDLTNQVSQQAAQQYDPYQVPVVANTPAPVHAPAVSVSPLDLCKSGDISKLSKQDQKATLGMIVEDLDNEMRDAQSKEALEAVRANVTIVKTYYARMSKGTKKDVDKLTKAINKKIKKYSK